jgi:hypothetical protein
MTRGLVVELRLAADVQPLPKEYRLLLVESELWNDVKYSKENNSWDGGSLGHAIFQRFVQFDEQRTATIRGLAPGLFRFKVFPDDLVIEPAEVVLGQGGEVVHLRWCSAR